MSRVSPISSLVSHDYTRKPANTRNLVGDLGGVSCKIGDKNARCEVENVTLI